MAHFLKNCFFQQVRCLAPRWNQRKPASVIEPRSYDSATDTVRLEQAFNKVDQDMDKQVKLKRAPLKDTSTRKSKSFTEKPLSLISNEQTKKSQKAAFVKQVTFDDHGHLVYTKIGNRDMRVSKLMAMVRSKKIKEKNKLMLLEGKTLIQEALQSGCRLEYLLFSRLKEVEHLKDYLPSADVKLLKMPYSEMQLWSDLVTSPGIMGIFHIPDTEKFITNDPFPLTVICDNIREPGNLGAILRACWGVGCQKVILTKGCVDVWETKVLRGAIGAHFKIHIVNKMHWDDIKGSLPKEYGICIADNSTVKIKSVASTIPVIPYFSVNFKTLPHIVLIIGGETEGISEESYKLADKHQGIRLNIPLSGGLNSLNSSIALGVIVFEIKRQLTSLQSESLDHNKIRNLSLNT